MELIPSRLFSDEDQLLLMSRLWTLLAKQTERYTMGDSTSVTVEVAGELLASLWHTLTMVMDETHTPYEHLLTDDLMPIVKQGQTILQDKLKDTKQLWEAVRRTAPDIHNFYYTDTLRGIGDYFKHYDLYFFAHQKPAVIDYPLLNPPPDTVRGLTYTEQYLKNMLAENLILHQFDIRSVICVLRAVAPDYQEFYMNLCEQSLTNAIGLTLIGKDSRTLHIGTGEQEAIKNTLQNITRKKLRRILRISALAICDDMNITEDWIREYISSFAETLYPRIDAALKPEDVSHIFIKSYE